MVAARQSFFVNELMGISIWGSCMVAPFFNGFFNELMGISIWRMRLFLIIQHENSDSVLFFTALLRRALSALIW